MHRWVLEMVNENDFRPKYVDRDDVVVQRVHVPLAAFNRFLFVEVGTEFRWGGRENWSDEDWINFAERPELETWVLYVKGTPAGYSETEHFEDRSARIHTFGLMRPFFGQGFGAHLLSKVVRRAFDRGAERIWLNTCDRDHKHALLNYQARGFRVIEEQDFPDE